MKASIFKLCLGVWVVLVVRSFMQSGCKAGVFVFGLARRGTLTFRTSELSFFLVLISPFQFVIAIYFWAWMDELGSQSGFSEVNTSLVCSFTSDIHFSLLIEIYEVVRWRARVNRVFSAGKKI